MHLQGVHHLIVPLAVLQDTQHPCDAGVAGRGRSLEDEAQPTRLEETLTPEGVPMR